MAMNKIEIDASTDVTGTIRIRLPDVPAHHPVHIIVEWDQSPPPVQSSWPAGWFAATAGAIDDSTFARASQGPYEEREGFE